MAQERLLRVKSYYSAAQSLQLEIKANFEERQAYVSDLLIMGSIPPVVKSNVARSDRHRHRHERKKDLTPRKTRLRSVKKGSPTRVLFYYNISCVGPPKN